MNFEEEKVSVQRRMEGAIEVLLREFSGLRTGRASISLLEPINVEAYGQQVPMNQVGTISVPEPRMLSVQVWDKSLIVNVEKAIRDSNLGLNPISEGQMIRIPIPPLNEERRLEITKIAGKYAEETKIAIRNVRRSVKDELKKAEKSGDISQDAHRDYDVEAQKLTDSFIKKVDDAFANKEQEIMQV
ncbi:MAG: ribosome recycling factor [Rhodospirillales bacterium]|tara:strand:- start:1381 stop:1941 length:561 start_codon:yes stop_codon:yes gene_type:complete